MEKECNANNFYLTSHINTLNQPNLEKWGMFTDKRQQYRPIYFEERSEEWDDEYRTLMLT